MHWLNKSGKSLPDAIIKSTCITVVATWPETGLSTLTYLLIIGRMSTGTP